PTHAASPRSLAFARQRLNIDDGKVLLSWPAGNGVLTNQHIVTAPCLHALLLASDGARHHAVEIIVGLLLWKHASQGKIPKKQQTDCRRQGETRRGAHPAKAWPQHRHGRRRCKLRPGVGHLAAEVPPQDALDLIMGVVEAVLSLDRYVVHGCSTIPWA